MHMKLWIVFISKIGDYFCAFLVATNKSSEVNCQAQELVKVWLWKL